MNQVKKIQKLLAQMPAVSNASVQNSTKRVSSLERYLFAHYYFRFNLLTEQTEFLEKGDDIANFRVLDKRELNTLAFELTRNGVKCGFGELSRYFQSSLIDSYHPFEFYLNSLPRWDGKDRVTDLAMRVSRNPLWLKGFRRWMLAMTAQWMRLNPIHANSVAPLLISEEQGMMKSTFCKSLIPESLQAYYTDQADLSAKGNMEQKLALMGLINLDEFDRLSPQRMAQLKNLMQMPSLNVRKAYQKNYRQLSRIASFIGTSNRKDLLTDPTGSRRFLCVEVEQKIDCSNIDLDQIYAQLKAELAKGKPYWFTSEEEEEIQQHNAAFYQVRPEEELFRSYFRAPQGCESYEELSLVEILDELRESHAHLLNKVDYKQFSAVMIASGITRVHTQAGNRYRVARVA